MSVRPRATRRDWSIPRGWGRGGGEELRRRVQQVLLFEKAVIETRGNLEFIAETV